MIRDHRDRSYWIIPVNLSEVQGPVENLRQTLIHDLRDPFKFDEPTMVRDHRDRRAEGIQPSICEQNFLSEMSRKVEQKNASATYVLKNTFQECPITFDLLSMLGRSIISDSVRWGSNQLRIHGDFNFIAGYWEWTEDILFHFEEPLQLSSIYDAVYASLYSYAKDINIMRAFCESWCPTTNTLHTQLGELSILLWDLYKLGGLPISGEIYDETVPPYDYFLARDKDGDRVLPQACVFLFAAYHYLAKQPESKKGVSAQQWVKHWYNGEILYASPVKRQRNSNSVPKHTHNPDGVLKDRPTTWTRGESALFDSLGIFGKSRRQTTYVAAFLSCWLCAFVLPENNERLIRPSTFEMATLMAWGQTFSLTIPFLASIYRGLNVILRSSKPAYSGASFPTHYVYGWLAHYFNTNYVVDPPPAGPLIVVFSGAQGAKCFNGQEARALIHEGSRAEVSISDLRDKVAVLCSSIESDPSRTKRKSPNDARDVAQPHRIDSNPEPITKTHNLHISSGKDDISTKANKVFDNDKSTSDAESDVNFKHQRGRRSKKPRVADSEGDEIDFWNAFDNIPIPSDIPTDLTKEATEPLNVLTDRTVLGKGKDIHIEKDLVERSNPASPAQSQHSVDGPWTFEINAKTLGTPPDDRGIPKAPSHGDAAPAPSISTIRITPASQGIFTSSIKILGNEYLTLLKQTPFDKVSDRHGEASQVYKAIRMMHGDPEPLKLEEETLAAVEELKLAKSSYDTTLTKHKGLEEESVALQQKEDELLKELEDVPTVHSTKRRVEELEVVPVCSAEEMELFEEQKRKLLEFQSSLDSSEWIV
ncbi:Serine/threonine-protein phosphatase 7 long form-like protein [Bienertia sinuspersici]